MAENDLISFDTNQLAKVQTNEIKAPTFKLVPEGSPILDEPTVEFNFDVPEVNPVEFASSLVETCIANRGLGLSANQCGFKYKVFVAGSEDNYVAYFNPEIIQVSDEEEIGPEGCLSFPHLYLNVLRPKSVTLQYQDFNGEFHQNTFTGLTARVIQHEYDHMIGVTFNHRTKPLALKSGYEKRIKMMQRFTKASKKLNKMAKAKR